MLVNSTPPPESLTALADELTAAAADGRLRTYLDLAVRAESLTATAPHPFFALDADDLADPDFAPVSATYAGWRYLLETNHRVVGLAITTIDDAGNHRFSGIGTGPPVSAVVYAVHIAAELLRDEPEMFLLAAIDIPALHIVLMQVSDAAGGRVGYLPVGLATSLNPARLYTRTELRAELAGMPPEQAVATATGEPAGG